jgi:hypothetical protein
MEQAQMNKDSILSNHTRLQDANTREHSNETGHEFCICEEHTDFKDEHCEDCQREWAYFQWQYRDFEIDLNLRD